jgi:hypothetical protein
MSLRWTGAGAGRTPEALRVNDEPALQRLFYSLSDESTYRSFLMNKKQHPHEEMQRLVDLDYDEAMALVACAPSTGDIVAMSRYDVDLATGLAEIAFVVRDDWQGLQTASNSKGNVG